MLKLSFLSEQDKVLHFLICLVVTLLASSAFASIFGLIGIVIGALVALMFGVMKEMFDVFIEKDNTVVESTRDALSDIVGIFVGVVISVILYIAGLL